MERYKPIDDEIEISEDEFKESDHPRKSDGKFGSGGGSASKGGEKKLKDWTGNEVSSQAYNKLRADQDFSKTVKSLPEEKGIVYRGTKLSSKALKGLKVGSFTTFSKVSSASPDQRLAGDYSRQPGASGEPVLFRISGGGSHRIPGGHKEKETAIPIGTKYKVWAIKSDSKIKLRGDYGYATVVDLVLHKQAADVSPKRAAGVIFVAPGDRVLLVERSDLGDQAGTWCFPGGMCEGDEEPADAAAREAKEETGRAPDALRRIYTDTSDGLEYTTFAANVPEEFDPVINDESASAFWFDLDDLPSPLHPGVSRMVGAEKENYGLSAN